MSNENIYLIPESSYEDILVRRKEVGRVYVRQPDFAD